jgi:hypothetical protein
MLVIYQLNVRLMRMLKKYNKYHLILAVGALSFSLNALASPLTFSAGEVDSKQKVVEVFFTDNGKWGLNFSADPNRSSEANNLSLSQKIDLPNLATYRNSADQFPLDLAEVVSYYYASETHDFTLALRYPDGESERVKVIYDFCIYHVNRASNAELYCKSMNVETSIAPLSFGGERKRSFSWS